MHISVDQVLDVAEREDALCARYVEARIGRVSAATLAGHLAERGIVRVREGVTEGAYVAPALLTGLLLAAVRVEGPVAAQTARGWIRAARRVVRGWRPSRWTRTAAEVEERTEVQVRVRRMI